MKQSYSKVLEQIPGVGKQIAQDMANIGELNDLSRQKPEVLARVKTRFEAWKKLMTQAEPRRTFRDF